MTTKSKHNNLILLIIISSLLLISLFFNIYFIFKNNSLESKYINLSKDHNNYVTTCENLYSDWNNLVDISLLKSDYFNLYSEVLLVSQYEYSLLYIQSLWNLGHVILPQDYKTYLINLEPRYISLLQKIDLIKVELNTYDNKTKLGLPLTMDSIEELDNLIKRIEDQNNSFYNTYSEILNN